MRALWLSVLCALILPLCTLRGADATSPAAPAATAPSPSPEVGYTVLPAAAVAPPMHWEHPEIANSAARVELSTYRASIARMYLLSRHPLKMPSWETSATVHEPDVTQPLAVLDSFNRDSDMHNQIYAMDLPREPADDGAWSWQQVSPSEVSFSHDAQGLTYRLDYAMDTSLPASQQKPQVTVTMKVTNHRGQTVALLPGVRPLDGIHQDNPTVEAPFDKIAAVSGSVDGAPGSLQTWTFPSTDGVEADVPPGFSFIALKSRFFAAWWTPSGNGSITDAAGKVTQLVPAYATKYASFSSPGFAAPYRQAQVYSRISDLNGRPFSVATGDTLSLNWSIAVSCMTSTDLARLSPDERQLEYTDAYYSFFKSIAKIMTWLLRWIAHIVHYYGLAVIILTILIKAALHRLTHKQYESTMRMQKLQPELKYLQEQYKNDKPSRDRKTMELWKKHGVNPLGGCLPMLVQIPLFIALYQSFYHSADMRGQSFLWISDLTLPDQLWYLGFKLPITNTLATINPLPILYILTTIWMSMLQKPPTSGDPSQEQVFKMMRWMPAVFGVIFYNMPAGLVLYFTLQAVLTALEIKLVKRRLGMT